MGGATVDRDKYLSCKDAKLIRMLIANESYANVTYAYEEKLKQCDDIHTKLAAARYTDDAEDVVGNSVLHVAANNNRVDIIEMLLEVGASIDAPGQFGYAPLHISAYRGHVESTKALIAAGASVFAKSDGGLFPFDVARNQYELDTGSKSKFNTVKLLMAAGSEMKNHKYITANRAATELFKEIALYHKDPTKYILLNNDNPDLACKALGNAAFHNEFLMMRKSIEKAMECLDDLPDEATDLYSACWQYDPHYEQMWHHAM